MIQIFIPRERLSGETRVAATPETIHHLAGDGCRVSVESGAGTASSLADADYESAGARLVTDVEPEWTGADIILKVAPLAEHPELGRHEAELPKAGAVVIGFMAPYRELATVRTLAERRVTSLPMELVPRITRAQSMDALSSQASIAGYHAVLLAASRLDRYFPLLMTAAGTVRPAKVVVVGAGVAGLQAIATAKRLGAVVEVSDIREAVREQVASLGGRFIDLPSQESGEGEGGYAREMGEDFLRRQREILKQHIATANVVITTALVPGKPAPRLVTADMVEAMAPGSVVVDLAADGGGNCELTEPGEEKLHGGVTILGPRNPAASMGHDASMLYARNVRTLLGELLGDDGITIDPENDVLGPMLLTHQGKVVHAGIAALIEETGS